MIVLLVEGDQVKQKKFKEPMLSYCLRYLQTVFKSWLLRSLGPGQVILFMWVSVFSSPKGRSNSNGSTLLSYWLSGAWYTVAIQCMACSNIIIGSLILWILLFLYGFPNTRTHCENGEPAVCSKEMSLCGNFFLFFFFLIELQGCLLVCICIAWMTLGWQKNWLNTIR